MLETHEKWKGTKAHPVASVLTNAQVPRNLVPMHVLAGVCLCGGHFPACSRPWVYLQHGKELEEKDSMWLGNIRLGFCLCVKLSATMAAFPCSLFCFVLFCFLTWSLMRIASNLLEPQAKLYPPASDSGEAEIYRRVLLHPSLVPSFKQRH